jgi:hypothetical protein
MKSDIDEEITLRQGYIDKERILFHINRRLPDLAKYNLPSNITTEAVFNQFLNVEEKLIPMYHENVTLKKDHN